MSSAVSCRGVGHADRLHRRDKPRAEVRTDADRPGGPGVWNQIRVAVRGNRIRVWLNRMHPSADKDRGLRIDYTDKKDPIPSGNVGVRAHGMDAWFDNVVVLPIDALSAVTATTDRD